MPCLFEKQSVFSKIACYNWLKKALPMLFEKCDSLKNTWWWYFNLFLLLIWAPLQYTFSNRVYALYIIIFFILLRRVRNVYLPLIVASIFFILVFNTYTIDTWADVKNYNTTTAKNRKMTLQTILTPRSGLEVIPDESRQMLSLIQKYNLPHYRISPVLRKDELVFQRIYETAWPVKMKDSSPYLFVCPDELQENKKFETCSIVEKKEKIALVYLP